VRARATVDGLREDRRATVHDWLVGGAGAAAAAFMCCCEKSEGKCECEVMKEEEEKETRTDTYRNQKKEGDGLGYRVSELEKKLKTIGPKLMWLLPHPALLRFAPAYTLVKKQHKPQRMKDKEYYNNGSGGSPASMKLENRKAKMQGSRFATLSEEIHDLNVEKIT